MRRHRFAALSVVAAALVAAVALGAASAADRTPASATAAAGSITLAIGSEPTSLDPQLKDDGGERAVSRNIYETLMARTRTGKLVPGLAAAAPKQIRPKVWRVTLRNGISFTNGEPLNAAIWSGTALVMLGLVWFEYATTIAPALALLRRRPRPAPDNV